MRKIARVDGNQREIVQALTKVGCSVVSLAPMGKGVPDILVGRAGQNFLLEIKNGALPPSKRKLTTDEQAFFDTWQGQKAVVGTPEEAIREVTKDQNDYR